jgi:hypothetical protein
MASKWHRQQRLTRQICRGLSNHGPITAEMAAMSNCAMSALLPKADVHCGNQNVCFGPAADIRLDCYIRKKSPRTLPGVSLSERCPSCQCRKVVFSDLRFLFAFGFLKEVPSAAQCQRRLYSRTCAVRIRQTAGFARTEMSKEVSPAL